MVVPRCAPARALRPPPRLRVGPRRRIIRALDRAPGKARGRERSGPVVQGNSAGMVPMRPGGVVPAAGKTVPAPQARPGMDPGGEGFLPTAFYKLEVSHD